MLHRDFEKILSSCKDRLNVCKLCTEVGKEVEISIPPSLVKLPMLEPIYLHTVQGKVVVVRQK